MLFKDVYEDYIQRKSGKLAVSTLRYYRGYWRNWLSPHFEQASIYNIGGKELAQALSNVPPTQRNRIKTFVSGLFKHAEIYCECKGLGNPAQAIERSKENPRKRYVHAEEWRRLSKGLLLLDQGTRDEKRFALFIRLILFTGVRKGEAENALIENVDFDRGTILVEGKTGEREVPLQPLLLKGIQDAAISEGFIFPAKKSKDKGMNYAYRWGQFRKQHGLPDITRHDLRRTFGVTGLNNGLSLEEVQGLLGHTSITTTEKHYAWLTTSSKKEAASKMEATLKKNLA